MRIGKRKIDTFPYLMCLPAIILFTIFIILPFFDGLYMSFFKWDGFSEPEFIGLRNYSNSIHDSLFWLSMKHTFIYAILVTVIKNVLAFLLAYILVRKVPFQTLFRTGIYLPVTLSYVVIGVLWSWVYNPTFGLINSFLTMIGKEEWILGWLSDPDIALYSVVVVDVWKWLGYHMVLYLAGMQAISKDYYEAASIDGANGFKQLIHITIPQLNSTIVVNVLMSLTGAFASNYDIVNVMTGGGPANSTEVSLTYIVSNAFRYSNMGKANAMSMILFAFVFVFGFIQLRIMSREDGYDV